MNRLTAISSLLAVTSSAVLAHSEPQSTYLEFDCTIVQICDHQFLCKQTSEPTQIVVTSLVHDLLVSEFKLNSDYPFREWQEQTAWLDLINPRAGKLPLPVWYPENPQIERIITFRLEDWLSGKQDSPYDVKGYALVMTGDVQEIMDSRTNVDETDDLPWKFTFYKKYWGEAGKYSTQRLLCDSDL